MRRRVLSSVTKFRMSSSFKCAKVSFFPAKKIPVVRSMHLKTEPNAPRPRSSPAAHSPDCTSSSSSLPCPIVELIRRQSAALRPVMLPYAKVFPDVDATSEPAALADTPTGVRALRANGDPAVAAPLGRGSTMSASGSVSSELVPDVCVDVSPSSTPPSSRGMSSSVRYGDASASSPSLLAKR